MNVSVFVTIWISSVNSAELSDHFLNAPLLLLKANPGVAAVEFYTPEPGDVPVLDDVPVPALIVEIHMNSEQESKDLVESQTFKSLFTDKQGMLKDADKINLEITRPVHFDLPGHDSPPPRTAPMTFVVRYYGPVKDATKFANFYTANHPPILAKFPNIRNVLCYLPLDRGSAVEISDDSLVIGNEVVFDDLATFKAALETEVLKEAMEDAEQFDSYGYSSHHAMHRELVYERAD